MQTRSFSPGSSSVSVLAFLLFLELADLPCIEDLYLWLPLLIVPPQEVAGSDLNVRLSLDQRVITEGNEIAGGLLDVKESVVLHLDNHGPAFLAVVLQLLSDLMGDLHHKLCV